MNTHQHTLRILVRLWLAIFLCAIFFTVILLLSRDIFVSLSGIARFQNTEGLSSVLILAKVSIVGILIWTISACALMLAGFVYFRKTMAPHAKTETNQDAKEHTKRDEIILSTIEDGVCVLDKDFTIVSVNNAGKQILGKSDQDLIGKSFLNVASPRFSEESEHKGESIPFEDVIKEKATIKFDDDVLLSGENGYAVEVKFVVAPLVLDHRVEGAVVVFEDVTKVKETDRMKSEFISVVSHQLRTPLTAIRWFNEMLANGEDGRVTKNQKQTLIQMHDSVIRMINLVNALLNVSRIESGGISIDPEPTDLKALIQNLVSEYQEELNLKSQHLKIDVSKDIHVVNVDPILMTEVYANLLSNALKFTPEKGSISVSLKVDGDNILSQITDSGCGIPSQKQQDVFTKYFGAEKLFLSDSDGTGLGLYIAKSIIEASGGSIWYDSVEGKGTTFSFTVPKAGMAKREGDKEFITNTTR